MALNTFKCDYLTPLNCKGLKSQKFLVGVTVVLLCYISTCGHHRSWLPNVWYAAVNSLPFLAHDDSF